MQTQSLGCCNAVKYALRNKRFTSWFELRNEKEAKTSFINYFLTHILGAFFCFYLYNLIGVKKKGDLFQSLAIYQIALAYRQNQSPTNI